MASPRPSPPSEIRLQKFLAAAGLGSRRHCEALIARGLVAVDGRTVTEQGVRIDPACQAVTVRGRPVQPQHVVHLALHKPRGYLCTSRDPSGRPTFHALLPDLGVRLYSAGRLDFDSEGLLVVTNDGELVEQLTHPRHELPKRYRAWLDGPLSREDRRRALAGVRSKGETLRADDLRPAGRGADGFAYDVTLHEGRNREVRRLAGALGRAVQRLQRVAIGPLELADLPAGEWRHLGPAEVAALRRAAGGSRANRIGR